MKVGMLTSPFGREPLAEAVRFAADAGFDALEIATGRGSAHCDVTEGDAKAAQEVSRLVTTLAWRYRVSVHAASPEAVDHEAWSRDTRHHRLSQRHWR